MRFRLPGAAQSALTPVIATTVDSDTHSSDNGGLHNEKHAVVDVHSDSESIEKVDPDAQHGVQRVQAMTHVWSKRDLIAAYIM